MNDRALVLAAHGSWAVPAVNQRIERWCAELARDGSFGAVVAAFHQGAPGFAEVLDGLAARDVTVVPVMTSAGYYATRVLPRELAKNNSFAAKRIRITPAVGTHAEIGALARARFQSLCVQHELTVERVTITVVGHGTRRSDPSRHATVQLASELGYTLPVRQALAVFLDDDPPIEETLARATGDAVVVLPFLIGSGPHAANDIPNRLMEGVGASQSGRIGTLDGNRGLTVAHVDASSPELSCAILKDGRAEEAATVKPRVVCDRPLGEHDEMLDVIRALAGGDASAPKRVMRRPLRLGTRNSALAMWQAEHVAKRLRDAGTRVDIVPLSTLGDRVRDRAIADLPGDAPFADELESALENGAIDLAVHSLKDLSIAASRRLGLVAYLPRGDARESLVSRDGLKLMELPRGAVVGTSSPRRVAQLRGLRPDLVVKTIRGPVDERVRAVRRGDFDAAILALAGLDRLGLAHEATEVFPIERFTPAPAQAAMVVQVRAGDAHATELCTALDDRATRLAVTLELNVLRAFGEDKAETLSAFATVGDGVELFVRIASPDGAQFDDRRFAGDSVEAVHEQVVEALARDGSTRPVEVVR